MTDDLARLRRNLCRELAQSELDAAVHTRRELSRLGSGKPSTALAEVAAHAEHLRPRLGRRDPVVVRHQRRDDRCQTPISIVIGHIMFGMVLGAFYARP